MDSVRAQGARRKAQAARHSDAVWHCEDLRRRYRGEDALSCFEISGLVYQVTIPKNIRDAAEMLPGCEVAFTLDAGRIVIIKVSSGLKDDRRAELQAAAAKVRESLDSKFRQMGADEIIAFLRSADE